MKRNKRVGELPTPQMDKFTDAQLQLLLAKFMVQIAKGSREFFTRQSAKDVTKELLRRHYARRPVLYWYFFRTAQLRYAKKDRAKRVGLVQHSRAGIRSRLEFSRVPGLVTGDRDWITGNISAN